MKLIWNRLKAKGFIYLRTRDLNQDPLEHLFGCIRANCGSNNNPTVSQFQAALKTAIVNGLAFKEASGTNCEEEVEPGEPLDKLHAFLSGEPDSSSGLEPSPAMYEFPPALDLMVEDIADAVAYVSGYIARRSLQDSNCNHCKALLTTSTVEDFHAGISAREYYADNFLTYPTKELCKAVGEAARVLEDIMRQVAHLPSVRKLVAEAIKRTVDFSWIGERCVDHQVPIINGIIQGICAISIPWWCKRRNRTFVSGNSI